ncbi:uncharacterized protein LOC141690414 [Apium graveolens]|uniref:uncharacterized protein LOC141690414 n=1 Tax=Apium graveolens TaxID=4045 RepID=UPI003D7A9FD1
MAGKVTLLQTAAQSIPNFWISLLLVLVEICNKIETKMNGYWWGGAARYYANTDFLEAKLGANPNFMWRSIMASQDIVKQYCRRKIVDGKSTIVWHIPWLPCRENGYPTTTPHYELKDIVMHNLMRDDHKSLDVNILNDLFNERDRLLIEQISIPSRSRPDSWYWALDDKSAFSVKSCCRSIRGENTNTEGGFWKQVWGLKLPGKPETPVHTLFTCTFAKEMWEEVRLQAIIPVDESETVLQVLVRAFKWRRSQEHQDGKEQMKQHTSIRQWRRPQEGWVKVNVDAACRDHSEFIGIRCVVRDDSGGFVRARSERAR